MHPAQLCQQWIEEEKHQGAHYAQHAVLSTQGLDNTPHGRIVAIREINEDNFLLFTQKRTRKVAEIENNPATSLTFWFERHTREIVIEGSASFLSADENRQYWSGYPKQAQIRFLSYAPTSGLPIDDKQLLEDKRQQLKQQWSNKSPPLSPDYCGIVIKPQRWKFYTYRLDELSDVWEYQLHGDKFIKSRLSP